MIDRPPHASGLRTLVVVLALHRSGSSVTTQVLQRLGMSLGPFPLLGANVGNRHGHYEALPILELNRELQEHVFGFSDDVPRSAEVLERFCATAGRWPENVEIPEAFHTQARGLIAQLIESGSISGFKDPRMPVLWPFWETILGELSDVRVVPVFVVRSPHEVAMSVFERSRADLTYHDGLDTAAVHLQCLAEIRRSTAGPVAVVRYGTADYVDDLRNVAEVVALPWDPSAPGEAFDESCRHHTAVRVPHRAQALFDEFCGAATQDFGAAEVQGIDNAARQRGDFARQELRDARERFEDLNVRHHVVLDDYHQALRDCVALRTELGHVTAHRDSLQQQFAALERHWFVGPLLRLRRRLMKWFRREPAPPKASNLGSHSAVGGSPR
ncbi:MAG TPA: hypothetical protein VHB77_16775 [Planctomycetaceae bacterium]|nr:hypothetical protein [Planctomycetaceae bacterium]